MRSFLLVHLSATYCYYCYYNYHLYYYYIYISSSGLFVESHLIAQSSHHIQGGAKGLAPDMHPYHDCLEHAESESESILSTC